MCWFSWNPWDTLIPSTAFFGQSMAMIITYNHNGRNADGKEDGAVTYLPVFMGWR